MLVLHRPQEQVLARCAVMPFVVTEGETGKRFFQGVTLIAPPAAAWGIEQPEALAMFEAGIEEVWGCPLTDEDKGPLSRQVHLKHCADFDIESLLQVIEQCGDRQFVMVPWITHYRDATLARADQGPSTLVCEEDLWVPHVIATIRRALNIAKRKELHVLMTSEAEAPMSTSNHDALQDLERCVVLGLRERPAQEIMSSTRRWIVLAKSGKGQEALAELDAQDWPAFTKQQARAQVLAAAGDNEQAASLIRELLPSLQLSELSAVKWAKVCVDGDETATGRSILNDWVSRLVQETPLSDALRLSTQLQDSSLVESAWTRLAQLFPQSEVLSLDCELRLVQYCRSGNLTTRIGFSEALSWMSDRLTCGAEVDYQNLLQEVTNRFPEHRELAYLGAALHAEAQNRTTNAVEFAAELVGESRFSPAASNVLLRIMQGLFLFDGFGAEQTVECRRLLRKLIGHLAQRPQHAVFRGAVVQTLDVEAAGRIGLPILASVAFEFAKQAPAAPVEPADAQPVEPEELGEFMKRFDAWVGEGTILDPRASLPVAVAGPDPAGVMEAMRLYLEHEIQSCQTIDELRSLEYRVHSLTPLSKHAPAGAHDIDVIRVLAARFSLFGDHQHARDLAEHILGIAGQPAERRRLAWGAYADIYLRTRSYPDALVGIACAFSIKASLPAASMFHEWYTALRVARELRFDSIAQELFETCQQLLEMQETTKQMRHRLTGIGLGLRVSRVARNNLDELAALLTECAAHLEEAFDLGDEAIMSAFQFGQVAGFFERAGGQLTSNVIALRERAYAALGPDTASFLRAISAVKPTGSELVALHNMMAEARYAVDAPSDLAPVTMSAHRILAATEPQVSPAEAFLAIELLADRGLKLPAPLQKMTIAWPIQQAQSLAAQDNLAVLMLGLDEDGHLVAAIADGTGTYVVRQPEQGKRMRDELRVWNTTYPYRYSDVEGKEGISEICQSMALLGVPMPQGDRVLVVAEPEIAQLTFNLVLNAKHQLAGYDTAFAVVPSLSWLTTVRAKVLGERRRRMAWVSHRELPGILAMQAVKGMIEPTLDKHGIELDISNRLPEGMQDTRLAIVTAHGQLTGEQRYIHRIVDEGDLVESPAALARTFGGVDLVILFVCSGGRLDRHPLANTSVGLSKMLLAQGSRAVVASPWPLNSIVPGNWLRVFMEYWDNGACVMDACFAANSALSGPWQAAPQETLAMVVYGDGLLRNPGAVANEQHH
jgi:hypothetical protein